MSGLPWARRGPAWGHDGEADAELQTDVMRFMAILGLCLVAVFALVQSLPLAAPVTELPPGEPARNAQPTSVSTPRPVPVPSPVQAVPAVERRVATRSPEPIPRSVPRPIHALEPLPVPMPEPEPAQPSASEPEPHMAEAQMPELAPEEGFSLSFRSDAVLERLVAAGSVGLYARTREHVWSFSMRSGRGEFLIADGAPPEWHLMHASSVPQQLVSALMQQAGSDSGDAVWGVTLPAHTRERIDEVLSGHRGGALVIGSAGDVTLEALQ